MPFVLSPTMPLPPIILFPDHPLPFGRTAKQKLFVMATTPVRIFQFVGGPNYEALFSNYKTNPGFFELPGEIGYSQVPAPRNDPRALGRNAALALVFCFLFLDFRYYQPVDNCSALP